MTKAKARTKAIDKSLPCGLHSCFGRAEALAALVFGTREAALRFSYGHGGFREIRQQQRQKQILR